MAHADTGLDQFLQLITMVLTPLGHAVVARSILRDGIYRSFVPDKIGCPA